MIRSDKHVILYRAGRITLAVLLALALTTVRAMADDNDAYVAEVDGQASAISLEQDDAQGGCDDAATSVVSAGAMSTCDSSVDDAGVTDDAALVDGRNATVYGQQAVSSDDNGESMAEDAGSVEAKTSGTSEDDEAGNVPAKPATHDVTAQEAPSTQDDVSEGSAADEHEDKDEDEKPTETPRPAGESDPSTYNAAKLLAQTRPTEGGSCSRQRAARRRPARTCRFDGHSI